MITPEDLERAARAIDQLLRGAISGTIKKKEAQYLEPIVSGGVRILEDGARKMRDRRGRHE